MFCKKCGYQEKDGDKFCENCGEPIKRALVENEKTVPTQDAKPAKPKEVPKPVFKSDFLEKVADHLEFLGYQVEKQIPEKEDGRPLLIARNTKKPTLIGFELEPGITMFRSNFGIEKPASDEMSNAVNLLSSKLDVTNAYYEVEDNEVTLRFEAIYTGDYKKEVFGKFVDFFNRDIGKMYSIESVNKAFVD